MLKNVVKQKTFSDSRLGDIPKHIAIDDLNEFLLENEITPDRIISITKDYGYPNKLDLFYHVIEER